MSEVIGLRATLSQSKTTGPGKKVRYREIQISPDAYLVNKAWLPLGAALWKQAVAERQNFVVLPTDDYKAFTNMGTTPADRAALTRQILSLAGLSDDGLQTYEDLITIVAFFWTEHSFRATLVSFARAMHVPKTITDKMGWWGVNSQPSEGYVRSYRVLISKVQATIADAIRKAKNKPDDFGEIYVFEELENI